jgi:hypothetical protein
MATRDLTYTIGIDASDAAAGLRKLETSVRSAMRTVDDELGDGATAGDKLAASLDKVASQTKEDLNSAAIAAEELQRALKAAGSGLEVGDALTSLSRMGLSFDEITQDADKLAVSLKGLGDVRAEGVKELDSIAPGLATKLDDVNKSADSSRSALANMVGNSAQSMGEAVGVVGDLGVGIGQLGEYFADATLDGEGLASAFKSMATVAGPMLALSLITKGLSDIMGRFSDSQERSAQSVGMWEDALQSGGDASENYADALRDLGKVTLDVTRAQSMLGNTVAELDSHWYSTGVGVHLLTNLLGLSTDETKDMTKALADAGVTVDRWTALIEGGAPALAQFAEALSHTNLSADEQKQMLETLTQAQEDHAKATANDTVMNEFFGESSDEKKQRLEEEKQALDDARQAQEQATEAAKQHAIAVAGANDELAALVTQASVWSQRGGIMTSLLGDVAGFAEAKSNVRDIAIAIGELPAELSKVNVGDVLANATSADALLDKLDSIGGQVRERIADAFATGGPEAAQTMASDYVDQVTKALDGKFTSEQVAEMLGLGDVKATIDLAVSQDAIARAKATIAAVTGVSGETPFTASIGLAIDAGTLSASAAQAIANWQAQEAGIDVPFEPVTDPAAIAEANAFMSSYAAAHPAVQPIEGDPTAATKAVDGVAKTAEGTDATVPIDGDPKQGLAAVGQVDQTATKTKPIIDVNANIAAALITMAIISAIAQAMAPKVTLTADTKPAVDAINGVGAMRPRVPATVYVADYPTAGEIQQMIGRPRIPVDIVVGQSIRITGVRD